jgi:hypothetical protein
MMRAEERFDAALRRTRRKIYDEAGLWLGAHADDCRDVVVAAVEGSEGAWLGLSMRAEADQDDWAEPFARLARRAARRSLQGRPSRASLVLRGPRTACSKAGSLAGLYLVCPLVAVVLDKALAEAGQGIDLSLPPLPGRFFALVGLLGGAANRLAVYLLPVPCFGRDARGR